MSCRVRKRKNIFSNSSIYAKMALNYCRINKQECLKRPCTCYHVRLQCLFHFRLGPTPRDSASMGQISNHTTWATSPLKPVGSIGSWPDQNFGQTYFFLGFRGPGARLDRGVSSNAIPGCSVLSARSRQVARRSTQCACSKLRTSNFGVRSRPLPISTVK